MTWNKDQEKRKWYDTEAGDFLNQSELVLSRTHNAVMRHFIYQSGPFPERVGDPTWSMKGTIKELELIARDELPIAGLGELGRENLQEVLKRYREKDDS